MIPPKPDATEGRGSVIRFARAFRRDLLSALPARLYRAWMAEFRSPLIHSFLCNDPDLIRRILQDQPGDFPKSDRLRVGLAPLLGRSVFVTNGDEWAAQRRIIDPAFEGVQRRAFPAMRDAARAALARMPEGEVDIEPLASHAAADIIFRTLFSLRISDAVAAQVFEALAAHQRAQPVVNAAAILPWPRWLPRRVPRRVRDTAAEIRGLIAGLVRDRAAAIAAGDAPDDLATRIMTTPDPVTGQCLTEVGMLDQVAIFFLAGHETSAAALSWALWLLAASPDWQDRVAAEALALPDALESPPDLPVARAVFREALRLYPPVPMMVREAACPVRFRDRKVPKGAQLILSPWHLHRHERIWKAPDAFDPGRWFSAEGRESARRGFIPFSAGPRVCPGAGFAMLEGPLLLSLIARDFRLSPGAVPPVPVARLTVRGRDGIHIRLAQRKAALS